MRYIDLTPEEAAQIRRLTTNVRKGRPDTDDCTFCGHPRSVHVGNSEGLSAYGCAAPECGDPAENRGRCALYGSQASADEFERYVALLDKPVMVTPQMVANRLHERRYGRGEDHFGIHSCPCYEEALYFLGVEERLGVYWPDGKGGNAWDPHNLDAALGNRS